MGTEPNKLLLFTVVLVFNMFLSLGFLSIKVLPIMSLASRIVCGTISPCSFFVTYVSDSSVAGASRSVIVL